MNQHQRSPCHEHDADNRHHGYVTSYGALGDIPRRPYS
jgi:hypothetical protein